MPTALAQKLKIKEGFSVLTFNAPSGFEKELGDLPEGVSISADAETYHQIHWFVKEKAQAEEEAETVLALLKEEVTLWVYFPKGTSKIKTDLTRDRGWEGLLKQKDLQWLTLISFNETWSAFSVRLKTSVDKKKGAAPKIRPIVEYIDAAKKLVFPPDDFATALQASPTEKAFFETLSFTNKKEYVEWIVSAKREETRITRVKESIERLGKGWKNPANR